MFPSRPPSAGSAEVHCAEQSGHLGKGLTPGVLAVPQPQGQETAFTGEKSGEEGRGHVQLSVCTARSARNHHACPSPRQAQARKLPAKLQHTTCRQAGRSPGAWRKEQRVNQDRERWRGPAGSPQLAWTSRDAERTDVDILAHSQDQAGALGVRAVNGVPGSP